MKKLFFLLVMLNMFPCIYAQREIMENHYHTIKVTDDAIQEANNALNDPNSGIFNHQQIYWEMSDMLFFRASFKYQYMFDKERPIAIYIPISIRFGKKNADVQNSLNEYMPVNLNRPDESDFYIGLGLKFYPIGIKNKFDFFIASEMRFGSFSDKYDYPVYIEGERTVTNYLDDTYFYSAFILNPGIHYKVLNHFLVGLELDLGLYLDKYNSLNTISSPSLIIGLSF